MSKHIINTCHYLLKTGELPFVFKMCKKYVTSVACFLILLFQTHNAEKQHSENKITY